MADAFITIAEARALLVTVTSEQQVGGAARVGAQNEMNHYVQGADVNATANFEVAGVLTDPDAVTVAVEAPDGTVTTYTYGTDAMLTKVAVGVYNAKISTSQSGIYSYRFNGSGAAAGSTLDQAFITIASAIVP